MIIHEIDLTKPSYRSAYQIARAIRLRDGIAAANAEFARLLWHVHKEDGGFIGLTDDELVQKVQDDPRLRMADVLRHMWAPGHWPSAEEISKAA